MSRISYFFDPGRGRFVFGETADDNGVLAFPAPQKGSITPLLTPRVLDHPLDGLLRSLATYHVGETSSPRKRQNLARKSIFRPYDNRRRRIPARDSRPSSTAMSFTPANEDTVLTINGKPYTPGAISYSIPPSGPRINSLLSLPPEDGDGDGNHLSGGEKQPPHKKPLPTKKEETGSAAARDATARGRQPQKKESGNAVGRDATVRVGPQKKEKDHPLPQSEDMSGFYGANVRVTIKQFEVKTNDPITFNKHAPFVALYLKVGDKVVLRWNPGTYYGMNTESKTIIQYHRTLADLKTGKATYDVNAFRGDKQFPLATSFTVQGPTTLSTTAYGEDQVHDVPDGYAPVYSWDHSTVLLPPWDYWPWQKSRSSYPLGPEISMTMNPKLSDTGWGGYSYDIALSSEGLDQYLTYKVMLQIDVDFWLPTSVPAKPRVMNVEVTQAIQHLWSEHGPDNHVPLMADKILTLIRIYAESGIDPFGEDSGISTVSDTYLFIRRQDNGKPAKFKWYYMPNEFDTTGPNAFLLQPTLESIQRDNMNHSINLFVNIQDSGTLTVLVRIKNHEGMWSDPYEVTVVFAPKKVLHVCGVRVKSYYYPEMTDDEYIQGILYGAIPLDVASGPMAEKYPQNHALRWLTSVDAVIPAAFFPLYEFQKNALIDRYVINKPGDDPVEGYNFIGGHDWQSLGESLNGIYCPDWPVGTNKEHAVVIAAMPLFYHPVGGNSGWTPLIPVYLLLQSVVGMGLAGSVAHEVGHVLGLWHPSIMHATKGVCADYHQPLDKGIDTDFRPVDLFIPEVGVNVTQAFLFRFYLKGSHSTGPSAWNDAVLPSPFYEFMSYCGNPEVRWVSPLSWVRMLRQLVLGGMGDDK